MRVKNGVSGSPIPKRGARVICFSFWGVARIASLAVFASGWQPLVQGVSLRRFAPPLLGLCSMHMTRACCCLCRRRLVLCTHL